MILALILAPVLAAFALKIIGAKNEPLRDRLLRVFTALMFVGAAWMLAKAAREGEQLLRLEGVCGLGMNFRVDGFRALYVCVACFMWMMTTLLSGEYFAHYHNRNRYYFFLLVTLTGVIGLFYSDDLYTGFIFFEVMSMASYPWVAHEETPAAMRAAQTYLGVAVLGGMVTLMGIFMAYHELGDVSFGALRAARGNPALNVPAGLILFGFAAKAGMFPMHIWLPKAHPVAPAPASALLSGMLTKAGLFGVLGISMNLYLGDFTYGCIMLSLGLVTMLVGAVLALFSTNLKRTLACSSMSQIGYIVTGVSAAVLLGEEGSLPASGALTHMVNHSLLKLVLFMAAGVVFMNIHELDLNRIRGFGRGKILLHIAFLLGAVGLAGVPLFNVYISKTMIHEGLVEYIEHLRAAGGNWMPFKIGEWVFLFAAGITTGYMLKLYICLFWQKNQDAAVQARYDALNGKYMNARSAFALMASAALIPVFGVFAEKTQMWFARISASFLQVEPIGHVHFYSLTNLKGGVITLVIGTILYLTVVRHWMYSEKEGYIDRWPRGLDLEELVYRPVFCRALPEVAGWVFSVLDKIIESKLVSQYLAGAACGVFRTLDRAVEGKFVSVFLADGAVIIFRALDEMVDKIALFLRELLFVSRADMHREKSHSVFIAAACAVADGVFAVANFFKPAGKKRSVYDMRYGNRIINSISFGLLLCAMGLVAAVVYVFTKAGMI